MVETRTNKSCSHSDYDKPDDHTCGRDLHKRSYGSPDGLDLEVAADPEEGHDTVRQNVSVDTEPEGPVKELFCPVHGIQEQE